MMFSFSRRWLARFGPAIALFHLGLAMVAIHFAVTLIVGGSPMTPEIYGPVVYAIPAWVWASAQIVGQLVASFGAMIGGRRGAVLLGLGCVVIMPFYALLGAAASMAGQGTIVTAACLWLNIPACILSIIAAIGAFNNGRR